MVVITRGAEGMALQPRAGPYISVPAPNRTEVFDVVGAGDTVIAIITLGMIARWDPWVVATVAQLGAGIVIQKLGNATPTLEQLEEAANRWLQPGAASLR
jgi:bifunctional ADP-heptose synthase (sugar kinase/adenylyltransferase)